LSRVDPQLAVIIFLIAFIIGRVLARRAITHLDSTQKVMLVDGMGWQRVIAPVILLVLVGIYFVALKSWPERAFTLQAGFFGAALLLVVTAIVLTQRRIRRLNLPETYLRLISISQGVQFAGAAVLLGSLVAG
jgi:hypothetical protein